jgi:hypothetical protein
VTRTHVLVIQLGLGALLALTIARALPAAPGRAPPCARPAVVARDGRPLLHCAGQGAIPRGAVPRMDGAQRLLLGLPIEVNSASVADLMLLPRIGPVLARRITAARSAGGPFCSVEDLRRVKGIGPITLQRLRPLVAVEPASGDGGAER